MSEAPFLVAIFPWLLLLRRLWRTDVECNAIQQIRASRKMVGAVCARIQSTSLSAATNNGCFADMGSTFLRLAQVDCRRVYAL